MKQNWWHRIKWAWFQGKKSFVFTYTEGWKHYWTPQPHKGPPELRITLAVTGYPTWNTAYLFRNINELKKRDLFKEIVLHEADKIYHKTIEDT